jgi:nitrogen fixation/metabolism regulation signal transduction histidine kinase
VSTERRRRGVSLEHRVLVLMLIPVVVALAAAVALVVGSGVPRVARWAIAVALVAATVGTGAAARMGIARPLRSLANMIRALREGDYSMRAAGASPGDALGLVLLETNLLGEQLRSWRLGELEAAALLRTVMAEIDVAIFAFDEGGRLRLANRAAERLLSEPAARLLGRDAASLGLADALSGDARVADMTFPGADGRWGVGREAFRQDGRPHTLLVLTDLSRALRDEQLAAWRRLVRVLSHEINNSLAPIQSIAHTLLALVSRDPPPADLSADVTRGLGVIAARSEGLSRFMSSYARLAQLPPPSPVPLDVRAWVHRAAALEPRVPVTVADGPALTILGDADQLDQVLINIVRNAADAALERRGAVRLSWERADTHVAILIEDDGPGLVSTANLFTPFFTTKPNGSGIGLALSRQVVEAHGGTVRLANRDGARGCVATILLPVSMSPPTPRPPTGR